MFDPRIGEFLRKRPGSAAVLPFSALVWNARLAAASATGRRVVVHYVDGPGYLPFALPIWEAVARRGHAPRLAFYAAARSGQAPAVAERLRGGPLPLRGVIPAWTCAALVFYDLFLTTHQSSAVPLVRRGPRLCTFHGLPAKGGTFVPTQWRHLDGAFLHGPLQARLFGELGPGPGGAGRWSREVGFPKSDALVNGRYRRDQTLRELGLAPDRPVVLYAPSWEEGGSLRENGSEVVDTLLGMGVQVVVKLHPMSYYPSGDVLATGGVDWVARLRRFEERSDFRHVSTGDVAPLVAACDVLVTDVSSVAFEAFLVDRPVVFLDVPRFFEATVGRMYGLTAAQARSDLRYNCGRSAGRVVEGLDGLAEVVRQELQSPGILASKRAVMRNELVFNAGEGADHAASAILELLGLPGP